MKAKKDRMSTPQKDALKKVSQHVSNKKVIYRKDLSLWYDNAEVKSVLNISSKTLQRRRENQQIPFKKIGGKYYYPRAYFEVIMVEQLENKHLLGLK